jgi:succinyl-CoA synthetase beta subunit
VKSIEGFQIPLIVRLQGTNAEEAKELIDKSGLKVHSAIAFEDAAKLVTEVLK